MEKVQKVPRAAIFQAENFRTKKGTINHDKSCIQSNFNFLFTIIPIIEINEDIPQTFCLILTS